MAQTLLYILLFLGVVIFAINVYFRVKVYKSYNILMKNDVPLTMKDLLSKERVTEEMKNHPEFAEHIHSFSSNIRNSIRANTLVIVLITIFGAILMWDAGVFPFN